ncbi:FkbM family methyltransferase [Mesorhizobium sp. B2-4-3]|uniref:FkbM family methyltransferase n=1 Tax=Mesorhizobium sp. B2-4-3 TaxID=2589946 RepID=UPI0015E4833D|nr:FkbM family methyltransferase [Mesorhizobium sp. B2-4-3]
MRYFKRLIYLPHTATETLERLRQLDTVLGDTASKAVAKKLSWPTPSPSAELTPEVPLVQERSPSPTPGEVFAGYSAKDIRVFDLFKNVRPESKPGFVTDFLGTRTRTTSLWNNARQFDGHVFGLPVPHDLFEAIEWIGLLKAVVSAGSSFAMMELRAGWGPWLAAGAVACKHLGIEDVHLLGVEADPGRFELMRQHFIDNGLDPEAHCLLRAAVGTEAGHARWPRISDAANSGGGRPVRDKDGEVNQDDADYIPHAVHDYIDVEIVPLRDLLARRAVWDLIHIDVQGWEADLVAGSVEELGERAKWLVIGTHSRQLDGRLIATLHRAGWVLENEKPTRFTFDRDKGSLELMAEVDGTQIWRNPRFTSLHVGKGERKSVPNSSASIDVSNDPVSLAQEHVENARILQRAKMRWPLCHMAESSQRSASRLETFRNTFFARWNQPSSMRSIFSDCTKSKRSGVGLPSIRFGVRPIVNSTRDALPKRGPAARCVFSKATAANSCQSSLTDSTTSFTSTGIILLKGYCAMRKWRPGSFRGRATLSSMITSWRITLPTRHTASFRW